MIALALGRYVSAKPWSSIMALIGMTLGVVSIVSVHLISASISSQLDTLVPGQIAGFTHFLHRDNLTADDYFELRRQWRRGELSGVTSLAPVIDETTEIENHVIRVIGIDLLDPDQVMQGVSGKSDSFAWDGVWIDKSLESLAGRLSAPVNGIIDAPRGTLLADIGPAQSLLQWSPRKLSYIGVRVDDPVLQLTRRLESLLPGFGAGFPATLPDLELAPAWQLVSMAQQYPARQFGKSVLFNISALGLLALLVAWLLIFQVSVSWLRQLWPVFERLHVLGVSWAKLRGYFLIGMSLLGIVASVLGIVLGLLLAQWLLDEAMPVRQTALELDVWVTLKGGGSALLVCLIGGYMAFNQAKREVNYNVATLMVVVPAIVAAGYCLVEPSSGLAGGFLGIAVLAVVTGFLVAPVLRQLRRLSGYVRGPYLARLGVREAIWYPQDVSIALAGLTLAVGTAIGVGLMVDSFRADFNFMLQQRLDYDLVAEGDHETLSSLATSLAVSPAVSRVQIYRDGQLRVSGLPIALRVAQVDREEAERYGDFSALRDTETLLSEQAARVLDVEVGGLVMTTAGPMKVMGIFSGFGDVQARMVVDEKSLVAGHAPRIESLGIKTDTPDELLMQMNKRFPQLRFRLQTDIRNTALATFDQTFAITRVLIAIALLVATLSVYIAITALRINRPTAGRLLLTLGINRRETVGIDIALGVGFGAIALLLALPLGIAFGWILCDVINLRAFGWSIGLQLSYTSFGQPLMLGLGASVAACLLRVGQDEGGANVSR